MCVLYLQNIITFIYSIPSEYIVDRQHPLSYDDTTSKRKGLDMIIPFRPCKPLPPGSSIKPVAKADEIRVKQERLADDAATILGTKGTEKGNANK